MYVHFSIFLNVNSSYTSHSIVPQDSEKSLSLLNSPINVALLKQYIYHKCVKYSSTYYIRLLKNPFSDFHILVVKLNFVFYIKLSFYTKQLLV